MRILILHSRIALDRLPEKIVSSRMRRAFSLKLATKSTSLLPHSVSHLGWIYCAGLGTIWSNEAAAEVKRRIKERQPDIVHCHNLFPALSPAVY